MKFKPFKYQKKAIKFGHDNSYCGLFLDMGLGKTAIAISIISDLLYKDFEVNKVLIVAPPNVAKYTWTEEAAKWHDFRNLKIVRLIGTPTQRLKLMQEPADIHIISQDCLEWLVNINKLKDFDYDMIIIDELSGFKNSGSLRFKTIKKIRPLVKRVIGLTGTPATNGLIDLWSQIYILDLGERLGKYITYYKQDYFIPDKTNGHIVYSWKLANNACKKMIYRRIDDICMHMSAVDYLKDLPDRTNNYIIITPPNNIIKRYRKFKEEKIIQYIDNAIIASNAGVLAGKLLQFANGAVYDDEKNVIDMHSLKLDALAEIIESSNGKSIIVAYNFRHDLDRLKKRFKRYKPRELKVEKDKNDWNAGKIQLLFAHPKSVGSGLNLQSGGHIIVWYGLTWSLESYNQLNARLHRQGQKNKVIIHHLIIKGTIDEMIVRVLKNKDAQQRDLLKALKKDIKNQVLRKSSVKSGKK